MAFDANVLIYVLNPGAAAPTDPSTGRPVERASERVRYLLQRLQSAKERVIVPTPAFAEVLVGAEAAAPEYLATFQKSRHFSLADFDARAAVEHATIQRRRQLDPSVPKASSRPKAKFDDQIVAIASVAGVAKIYSDDADVQRLAKYLGMEAEGISSLPLPPEDPQGELELEPADRDQD